RARGMVEIGPLSRHMAICTRWRLRHDISRATSAEMTGSALAGAAEEVAGPGGVVGRAGYLGHGLIGREGLQVCRRGAVAYRLQGVVDGPHRCLEGLVALQRDAHTLAGKKRAVPEGGTAPKDDRNAQLRGRSLELLLGLDADQEHGVDACRFVGLGASDCILDASNGHGTRASCNRQVWVAPRRQG